MKKSTIITLSFITSALLFSGCGMLPYKESFSCEKGKENGICGSVSEVYDLSSDMEEFRKRANKEYAKEVAKKEQNKNLDLENNAFKQQKLQEMVEAVEIRKIQNETPTIFRYYLNEKEAREKAGLALVSENDKESKAIKGKLNAKKSSHQQKKTSKKSNPQKNNAKLVKKKSEVENLSDLNNTRVIDGITLYENNQSLEQNLSQTLDTNLSKDFNTSENLSPTLKENCSPNQDEVITQINGIVKVCVYSANIRAEASCLAPVIRVAMREEELEALYEKGGWIKLKDGTYVHKSIVTKE